MSRSVWKGPFSQVKYNLTDITHNKETRVWCRSSMILPLQVGKRI